MVIFAAKVLRENLFDCQGNQGDCHHHQERMFITDMAARANRDVSRSGIGNDLSDPFIDHVALAKSERGCREALL